MEPSFWHERWSRGQIGFHQQQVNPLLQRWWSSCGAGAGANVLVPLCGKTLDLRWLAAQGCTVTGVELSPLAAAALFPAATTPTVEGALHAWRDGEIEVLQGDFFDLERGGFDAFWDRAATIALPPDLRRRYAAHLAARVRPGAVGLLVTLSHDRGSGPPFSVSPDEVEALYGSAFVVEPLGDAVPLEAPSGPEAEQIYRLTRR